MREDMGMERGAKFQVKRGFRGCQDPPPLLPLAGLRSKKLT